LISATLSKKRSKVKSPYLPFFTKNFLLDLLCEEIPLDVTSHIMLKVKAFYEHHEYKDIKPVKKPIKTSNFTTIASEWDNGFFKNLTEEEMSDLILVLNF